VDVGQHDGAGDSHLAVVVLALAGLVYGMGLDWLTIFLSQ
jgi:hypothetical protein